MDNIVDILKDLNQLNIDYLIDDSLKTESEKILEDMAKRFGKTSGEIKEMERLEKEEQKRREDNNLTTMSKDMGEEKFLPILNIIDLDKVEVPKLEYLIEGILPNIGISMISGDPGSYKTWFYLYITYCLTNDKSLLDKYNIKNTNVLIINQDDSLSLIKDRINRINFSEDSKKRIYFWTGSHFKIDLSNDGEWDSVIHYLKKFIQIKNIGLVVFDTFREVHSGNENDSRDINIVLQKIKSLSNNKNVSFLLVHHNRKNNEEYSNNIKSPVGSVAISGGLISSIHLKTMKDGVIEVSQGKSKAGEKFKKFYMKFDINNKEDIFKIIDYKDKKSEEVIEIENFILDYFKDNVDSQNTKTNIVNNLSNINDNYSKKFLEESIDNLIKNGSIKQINENSQYNKKIYGLVS